MIEQKKWQSYWKHTHDRPSRDRSGLFETTPKSVKSKKRFIISRNLLLAIGSFVLLVAVGYFLLFSGFFTIKMVDVIGAVTPAVQEEIDKIYGKNILTYSSSGMAQRLKQSQSSIKELIIYKGLPDTVRIEIAFRQPVIGWRSNAENYFIDKTGVVFQASSQELLINPDNTLVTVVDPFNQPLQLGQKIVSEDFLDFIITLAKSFSERVPIAVQEIKVGQTTLEVEIATDKGWRVLFDSTRSLKPQLDTLVRVVEQFYGDIKEYIDLRIEGRTYYK